MKPFSVLYYTIILSCFLLAFSGVSTGSPQISTESNQSVQTNISEILPAQDVQSILASPEHYLGRTISLKGVVSKTFPLQHQFIVADRVGCSLCAAAKKIKSSITVRYWGDIPKNRETVRISGILLGDEHTGFILNATEVVS